MRGQIISMDGIQNFNSNQAESNDIVIAAVPREVSRAENFGLIYCRVWIYIPALNRKVTDLQPPSRKSGPETISAAQFSLTSLRTAKPPRIYTCRGYRITVLIGRDSSLALETMRCVK